VSFVSQRAEHARHIADYLKEFAWTHFATLTTDGRTSPPELQRRFANVFVRRLERALQGPVRWFYAIEGTTEAETLHVHALLWTRATLHSSQVQKAWPLGFVHLAPYVFGQGANSYVTKALDFHSSDLYDFSAIAPPRRTELRQGGV